VLREVERLRGELEKAHERITRQQEQLVKQRERERIAEQGKLIGQLEKELSGWRRNSTNSSKPPSSDGMAGPQRARCRKAGSKSRTKSKREPGGQVGHPGHQRKLVEPSRVSEIVVVLPEQCGGCGARFTKTAQADNRIGAPYRHQVLELPPIQAHVIEYQCCQVKCTHCGEATRATLPDEFRPQGAVAMARSGLSIFESLEKATPDEINLRFRRARGAIPYATILLAVGRPLQAQEVIQSSLRTNRELVANNKESLLYQHSLVWSLTVAGEIEHALKNDEQSRKLLKDAIGMAAPFHNKLDLGLLRAAADAQFTYSKVLSGSERCEALKGIRLIWQSYKGASSPWLEGRREQATRAVNACPAAQKLVASF